MLGAFGYSYFFCKSYDFLVDVAQLVFMDEMGANTSLALL
jgi:hypothetical protein